MRYLWPSVRTACVLFAELCQRLLMALSCRADQLLSRQLSGAKRTSRFNQTVCASDPNRTFGLIVDAMASSGSVSDSPSVPMHGQVLACFRSYRLDLFAQWPVLKSDHSSNLKVSLIGISGFGLFRAPIGVYAYVHFDRSRWYRVLVS